MIHAEELKQLIPYAVNFSIVVVAIVYFGRKPTKKYVFQRHEHLRDRVEASAKLISDAEARISLALEKINNFSKEAQGLLASAKAGAGSDGEQLLEKAKIEAQRIALDAQKIIENEGSERLAAVRADFLDHAIEQAAVVLKKSLKSEDHASIINKARNSIEVSP